MITVVNKRTYGRKHPRLSGTEVYIGRPTALGNPYTHLRERNTLARFVVPTVKEAMSQYRHWLERALADPQDRQQREAAAMFNRLLDLARKGDLVLICWCAPGPCHGDVVQEFLEARLVGRAAGAAEWGVRKEVGC